MPLFTAETARIAAIRSHAVTSARNRPVAPPEPPAPVTQPTLIPADDFTARKIARVRDQIERVENLLTDAVEPQAVDRFAAALARLYEIERILSGRPLPGSRRPEKDKPARTFTPGAWLDLSAPAVVVAHVEAPRLQDLPPACPSCGVDTPTGSVLPDNPMPSMPQDAAKP
jgi:hypothetical protein